MLEIWGRKNSSNVAPVMWAVGELGLEHTRHNAGGTFGRLDTAEYRAMNPNGLVPTMNDSGFVLWESNAIIRYLARQYGAGSLYPKDTKTLAIAEQWMEWMKTTLNPGFFPIFWQLVRTDKEKQDLSLVQRAMATTAKNLGILETGLDGREFVAGNALTLGDVALGPLFYRYFNLPVNRPSLPNVENWYSRLCERPAYQQHAMIPFGSNQQEWLALEKKGENT
jgi:glutathione S-transferase